MKLIVISSQRRKIRLKICSKKFFLHLLMDGERSWIFQLPWLLSDDSDLLVESKLQATGLEDLGSDPAESWALFLPLFLLKKTWHSLEMSKKMWSRYEITTIFFLNSSPVPAKAGWLFHRRRLPTILPSKYFAPYAIHYSKQHCSAMRKGIGRTEVERSSIEFIF